jgi:hypothetical protein
MLAHFIQISDARRVDDAVRIERDERVGIGGRGNAEPGPARQFTHIGAVLLCGTHLGADQLEIVPVIDDGGDHLRTDRPHTPPDHPVTLFGHICRSDSDSASPLMS